MPILREGTTRRLSVFVGTDGVRVRESAVVWTATTEAEAADGGAEEAPAALRARRTLRFEKLEVPRSALAPAKPSWTLAETRLADALSKRTCVRPTSDGAELLLRPQDVDLRPSTDYRQRTRMYRLTSAGLEDVDVTSPRAALFAQCGTPLVLRSDTWADFVAGPSSMLEQLLVRLCALAKGHFELGFVLHGDTLEWRLGSVKCAVELGLPSTEAALRVLFESLRALLFSEGGCFRFVWVQKRVLLVSAAWAAYLREELVDGVGVEAEFTDGSIPSASKHGSKHEGALATIPSLEDLISPSRVFARDMSYASLLARHFTEMTQQFEMEGFSATPRALRPEEGGRMHLSGRFSSSSWTSSLPGGSVSDIAPLVDELNRWSHRWSLAESSRRVYEYRIGMFAKGMLFASSEEAEALRETGWLVENWRLDWARRTLDEQGIEVSSYARAADVVSLGRQMAALMKKKVSFRIAAEGDALSASAYGKRGALALDIRQTLVPRRLARFARGVNAVLAEAEHPERWVVFTGEYDRRLLLVSCAWAKTLAEIAPSVAESLEESFECGSRSLLPLCHPRVKAELVTVSLPAVERLIPAARVCSSDFKCSARSTDYPELLDELARLAKLDVIVEPWARETKEPWTFFVQATFNGVHTELDVGNQKYADVTPMLDYLNGLLESTGSLRRLCFYAQAQDEGVVFVDREEAEMLAGFEIARWPET